MTVTAPPRSPTRPCAFCGGHLPPLDPAAADQPPHCPCWIGGGPLPEGTPMHDDDSPTVPIGRVTVTRQRVTSARPKVSDEYRELLAKPLDQTIPRPAQTAAFAASIVILTACLAAILVVMFR